MEKDSSDDDEDDGRPLTSDSGAGEGEDKDKERDEITAAGEEASQLLKVRVVLCTLATLPGMVLLLAPLCM